MTTTAPPPTRAHPAAAGGNVQSQLGYLKAHIKFQTQETHEKMRIDWKTVIDRAQSRRHITREIHRKINAKAPGSQVEGKNATPEAQEQMTALFRRLARGERISPGDGHVLSWNLRYRMIRAAHQNLDDDQFHLHIEEHDLSSVKPKDRHFPEHIREQLAARERTRLLVRLQGRSPRRNRDALTVEFNLCGPSYSPTLHQAGSDAPCPSCKLPVSRHRLVQIACVPGPFHQPINGSSLKETARMRQYIQVY